MADPVWTTSLCDYQDEDGPPGQVVVTNLHWEATQEDGGFNARQYGTINITDENRVFALPALQAVPEAVMTGWVQDAMGQDEVDAIEARLAADIAEQQNPTSGSVVPA